MDIVNIHIQKNKERKNIGNMTKEARRSGRMSKALTDGASLAIMHLTKPSSEEIQ